MILSLWFPFGNRTYSDHCQKSLEKVFLFHTCLSSPSFWSKHPRSDIVITPSPCAMTQKYCILLLQTYCSVREHITYTIEILFHVVFGETTALAGWIILWAVSYWWKFLGRQLLKRDVSLTVVSLLWFFPVMVVLKDSSKKETAYSSGMRNEKKNQKMKAALTFLITTFGLSKILTVRHGNNTASELC